MIEGKIKAFYDKQKLKKHVATKPALNQQKILKGILYSKMEDICSQENTGKNKSY
jgi:hypothetical protein